MIFVNYLKTHLTRLTKGSKMVSDAVRIFQDECNLYKRNAIIVAALNGEQVKLSSKEDVDNLVEQLHDFKGHKGVVTAGCNPWYVSVVRE